MKTYEFNRNDFEWADEFYEVIQAKMGLPDWFGKNADALWDMLTGYIETPCKIILIGFEGKENDFNEHILDLILKCFSDAKKKYPNKFEIEFK